MLTKTSRWTRWIPAAAKYSHSCISIRFRLVICNLAYDLKMAKHSRNMSSLSTQYTQHHHSSVWQTTFPLSILQNTTIMMNLKMKP